MDWELIKIRERPEYLEKAVRWFPHAFGVPEEAYRESMEKMRAGKGPVPQWYAAALADGEMIGGLGVIENDFHDRKDLAPNVRAVYVDEPYRGRGVAGSLLDLACRDMAELGIPVLYLATDHDSFYERYGWEFFCMVQGDEGPTRLYRHKQN